MVALTGGEGEVLDFSDGQIVLPLDDLVQTVLSGIDDATGLDLASRAPEIDGEYVLFESQDLADLQDAVAFFNALSWFLPIVTLLLLAGAIVAAPDRRLGVRRVGIAMFVPMLVTLAFIGLARQAYLDALAGSVQSLAAAEAAFDIVTNFLRMSMRVGLAVGLVLIIGAWLVGRRTGPDYSRAPTEML